jgi:uncharacterized membrane protein YtjA (UPF0391 family)
MAFHLLKMLMGWVLRTASKQTGEGYMTGLLKWAVVFLVISLIAALFGFGGLAQGSADIARVLFFIFLTICVVLFVLGASLYNSVR